MDAAQKKRSLRDVAMPDTGTAVSGVVAPGASQDATRMQGTRISRYLYTTVVPAGNNPRCLSQGWYGCHLGPLAGLKQPFTRRQAQIMDGELQLYVSPPRSNTPFSGTVQIPRVGTNPQKRNGIVKPVDRGSLNMPSGRAVHRKLNNPQFWRRSPFLLALHV